MQYRYRDQYEFTGSVVSNESITEPDLSYTVTELFQRMAQGLPLANNIIPTYYDDGEDIDHPDPTQRPGFDLADYTREMLELQATQAQPAVSEPQVNQKSEAKKDETPGDEPAG